MKRISESPLKRFNKSVNKHDLSPKKTAQKQHTVYNEEKLKVFERIYSGIYQIQAK